MLPNFFQSGRPNAVPAEGVEGRPGGASAADDKDLARAAAGKEGEDDDESDPEDELPSVIDARAAECGTLDAGTRPA